MTRNPCQRWLLSLIGTSYNWLSKLREKETERIMGALFWSAWLREWKLIYAAGFIRPLGSHEFASSPEIIDKFQNDLKKKKSHWIAKFSQQLLYLETGPEKLPSLCTGSTLFFYSDFCVVFSYRLLSTARTPQSPKVQKSPSEMLRKLTRLCLS